MSDGVGVAERTDEHGEQITTTASISVGDDVADSDIDAAQALLAAPYAAEPVLQDAFRIGIEPLMGLLANARWERIWPVAKKPVAKKPAAKKPAAKKPAPRSSAKR
jgi:DNA topoisomerase-1